MWASPPWKLAVTGGVGLVVGVALLSVHWTVAQLAAFVGLALVARRALHLVTPASFVDFAGAFAVLEVMGDLGVGITALVWPTPTLLSLALLVGSWAIVRATVGATIAVTTRVDRPWWLLSVAFTIFAGVLGVILVISSSGSVRGAAVTIGLLSLMDGIHEISEGALQARRAHGLRRSAHAASTAT